MAFEIKNATVDDVIAEVKSGRLSAADALKGERASEPVRSTLVEKLETMVKEESSTEAQAPVTSEAEKAESPYETVKVKVSKRVLDATGGRGTFYDPETRKNIGKEPVEVPPTPFVDAKLRSQELVRVRG